VTLLELARKADLQILAIHAAFGAPGDWGYEKREGVALFELYKFQQEIRAIIREATAEPAPDQIEAGAKAIYESKLLVQPRDPWDGPSSVTKIFCRQASESCLRAARSA
jgi:hypothetical protein